MASAVPSDDAGWRELILAGMPPFWKLMAEESGESVWDQGGVLAAIISAVPNRSIFNSVFYEDPEELLGSLEAIAGRYDEAGVTAWTVWVPEGDRVVAEALEAAGHALDAEPRAMGMELTELVEPQTDAKIELREELDMAEVARLNEIAYGYAPGEFGPVAGARIPGTRAYFAALDGDTVGTVVTWDHGADVEIAWVATLPEARGRGVSKRLMAYALAEAARRGQETTTLVATKLGYPVYAGCGFRDFGAFQMWERRSGGKGAESRSGGRSP